MRIAKLLIPFALLALVGGVLLFTVKKVDQAVKQSVSVENCDLACAKNMVENFIKDNKYVEAAIYLLEYAESNDTSTYCHYGLHEISKKYVEEVRVNGLDKRIIDYIDGCGSALIHGLTENYPYQGSLQEAVLEGSNFCNKMFNTESANWYNCIHGVGHGVAVISDSDITMSAKACQEVSAIKRAVEGCVFGVYMKDKDDIVKDDSSSYQEIEKRLIKTCDEAIDQMFCLPSYAQVFAKFGQDKKYVELCREKYGVIEECLARLGFYKVVLAPKNSKNIEDVLYQEVKSCTDSAESLMEYSACVAFIAHGIEGVGLKDVDKNLICNVLTRLEESYSISEDSYQRPKCALWE